MRAISTIGQRQQDLLKALLHQPSGMTVDELSQRLLISRNAVNQHLTALDASGYIRNSSLTRTGGRPSKVYTLTETGRELFPRHYSMFANLLIGWVKGRLGDADLENCLSELGVQVAQQFKSRVDQHITLADATQEVADIMFDLGYEARVGNNTSVSTEIIANNCVFHKLATDANQVCQLDLSLMSNLLNAQVEHKECMVKGGQCCRFVISRKQ